MFKRISEVSDQKTVRQPIIHRGYKFSEECGEFMVEVAIELGISGKTVGKDGVIGEAADVCITCLDIVHRLYPDLTEEQFIEVLDRKLTKWKNKPAIVK